MRLVGCEARIGKIRNVQKYLFGKSQVKRLLMRLESIS